MYMRLREIGIVFGQHVSYPEELVAWLRENFPDEDHTSTGKYDHQEKNKRSYGGIQEFFEVDWGACICSLL